MVRVELVWQGDLRFTARSGDIELTLDSHSKAGPSPVQTLAFALAGCMAMDVASILQKGRHPFTGLKAALTGTRAESEPRRLTRVGLHFMIEGTVLSDAVERAITLSREKYCSVWHSMRQDLGFDVTFEFVEGETPVVQCWVLLHLPSPEALFDLDVDGRQHAEPLIVARADVPAVELENRNVPMPASLGATNLVFFRDA